MINQERLIHTYLDLIKINSVSGNERPLAQFIAKRLDDLGLAVQWSYFSEEQNSPSIYAEMKGEGEGPSLLLIGHMDTVAVARGWHTDPHQPIIDGDKVYGLGSCDMKGGIAAILETLQSLTENHVQLNGTVKVAFASDEELLSRGTYQLLQEGLHADMAIMAECRFDEAAIGFRGRYSIRVVVKGEMAHASKYPHIGENAIIHASKLAMEIENLSTKVHPHLGEGTWCIRHIEGGIKETLSVPDQCELFVDRYVVPGETFEICKEQILDAARRIGLENKVEVELIPKPTDYMEAFVIPADHPLVTVLQENYEKVTGGRLLLGYDKSVCDSNFLVNIGDIPTITFGPSGENMHGANEYGYISQVKAAAQIYLDTVKKLLGEMDSQK